MDIKLIGEQISRLRKQAGLTQEELGKAVGVSTQAVSRWECGGAPDTALLPAIADALHTSIDALFGRDGSGSIDPETYLYSWMSAMPEETRWEQLAFLATNLSMRLCAEMPELAFQPVETCEREFQGQKLLFFSIGSTQSAFFTSSYAKDMTYFSLYPEPEKGYRAYFADCDRYRKFFSLLAMPHCLELMLDLIADPADGKLRTYYITVSSAAQRLGISEEDAAPMIRALTEAGFLEETTVELGIESPRIYGVDPRSPSYGLIPLLYDARFMVQTEYNFYYNCSRRETPYLRKAEPEGEKNHETKK